MIVRSSAGPSTSDSDASQVDLLPLTELALELAKQAGCDSCDAFALSTQAVSVEVRKGAVESLERSESTRLNLRVFVGKRSASVTIDGSSDRDNIAFIAQRAVAVARASTEDPFSGLAERIMRPPFPDLDIFDPGCPKAELLIGDAKAMEAAALDVNGVDRSDGAHSGWEVNRGFLATSDGFSGEYLRSGYARSCTAVASRDGRLEEDYAYSVAPHYVDLDPATEIGALAARRVLASLGPTRPSSRQTPIIFDRRVAGSIIRSLLQAVNGREIARRMSFLTEFLDRKICDTSMEIIDDPTLPRGLSSRPFDGEGVGSTPMKIVDSGMLRNFLLDSSSARQLSINNSGNAVRHGVSAPAPGSSNVIVRPGHQSPEALMESVGEGIIVTSLIGRGADTVTGDFSQGASGFEFVGAERRRSLSEFTVAGHLSDMFQNMIAANDPVKSDAILSPTLYIGELSVAGK